MFFKKSKVKKVHGEELIKCPRCNVDMEKLKKEDVIIDVCKKCKGMWLDAGEMEKLADIAQRLRSKTGEKNGEKEKS